MTKVMFHLFKGCSQLGLPSSQVGFCALSHCFLLKLNNGFVETICFSMGNCIYLLLHEELVLPSVVAVLLSLVLPSVVAVLLSLANVAGLA